MRYLTEKANLYAVKPLLLLAVERINTIEFGDTRSHVALGGGVQRVIAIAKFELSYLRTLRRWPTELRDNFIARLVFQNLF